MSTEFISSFPHLRQFTLSRGLSDHCPLVLKVNPTNEGPKPFRYFNYWAECSQFVEIVNKTASEHQGSGVGNVLRAIKKEAKIWAKSFKESENKAVQEIENKISTLEADIMSNGNSNEKSRELAVSKARLWDFYRREEREWLQKSRTRWFKEGDKDTKYFHAIASMRNRNNNISRLRIGNSVIQDHSSISQVFVQHFRENFNKVPTIPISAFASEFRTLFSESRSDLEKPFSAEEVWQAIVSADGSRAPGPDGFNLEFYKRFWPSVKTDVMKFFEQFYGGEVKDSSFKHSFLALIPKVSSPETVNDFRPINLVGSLYKILARVLSRRLAGCLGEIISENQFAFTAGKQLVDCVLIANETIDQLRRSKSEAVLFKADFRKAYDTVDWRFLDQVQQWMGFGERWRKWIQLCISSVLIQVLINGVPSSSFSTKRGLRQGCPISPMLFNILGEALSVLINKAVEKGVITCVSIGVSKLLVTHLQFADDLILFLEANEDNVRNTKRILRIFQAISGLQLNLSKTRMFGVNVDSNTLKAWSDGIKCKIDSLPTLYLGMPVGNSQNSVAIWKPIEDKVRSRIDGWEGKLLSFAGRVTLVRSILSNLPVFYMSLFPIPAAVANNLSKMVAKFFWGNSSNRPIHWVNWKLLCKPKLLGGLGLIDFKVLNRSLLNKWLWRYGSERNSYWRKTIDAKLDCDRNSLTPNNLTAKNMSWVWRGITKPLLDANDVYTKNLRFVLGNGNSLNSWEDVWLDDKPLKLAFPRIFALSSRKQGKIAEFGTETNGSWEWNIPLRRRLFGWEENVWGEFLAALNRVNYDGEKEDCIRWVGASSGTYRPKFFRDFLVQNGQEADPMWRWVWSKLVPPKVECFLWRALNNRIPTLVELRKRGVSSTGQALCVLCGKKEETVDHLFCSCSTTSKLWQSWCSNWNLQVVMPDSLVSLLHIWVNLPFKPSNKPIWLVAFGGIVWTIWLQRNEAIFKGKKPTDTALSEMAMIRIGHWCKGNWPVSFVSVNDFLRYPAEASIAKKVTNRPAPGSWIKPSEGTIKFNVDAAVEGSFGKAGVGGILRDHCGAVLIKFAENIGLSDVTGAELTAIWRACHLLSQSKWLSNGKCIIETDSLLAVSWIGKPNSCPPCFTDLVQRCTPYFSSAAFSIRFAFREENESAHFLAQEGRRKKDNMYWEAATGNA